jgi:heme-degrading monooxygenase HmoA
VIAIIWRYSLAPDAEPRFREVYGPDGDWARLFRQAPGFVRTDLLAGEDGGFATIDYWRDAASFAAFKAEFGAAYARLDAACEPLTSREQPLGVFEVVA